MANDTKATLSRGRRGSSRRPVYDNAVVAVEAPTPVKKKEALPAFALDFGNGA